MRYITFFLLIFWLLSSVYGAFLGTLSARVFFQSPGMVVFFALLWLITLAGLLARRAWQRNKALLLVHVGFLVFLSGAIWGSVPVRAWLNDTLWHEGLLVLHQGDKQSQVVDERGAVIGTLPFTVQLERFEPRYHSAVPQQSGHADNPEGMSPAIKNYVSNVTIMQGAETTARGAIAMNRPLRVGGYWLYHYDWNAKQPDEVTLMVVSQRGIIVVLAGYGLVMAGLVWYCAGQLKKTMLSGDIGQEGAVL